MEIQALQTVGPDTALGNFIRVKLPPSVLVSSYAHVASQTTTQFIYHLVEATAITQGPEKSYFYSILQ